MPEGVAAAAKAILERASASSWDTSSVEPFHRWCSDHGDPLFDACLVLPSERDEEINSLILLAPEAVERFAVRQGQTPECLASVVDGWIRYFCSQA